jgi:hypothetical protein
MYSFRLRRTDGTPTEPPRFRTVVRTWRAGDVIPLGLRSLRVVEVRDDDATRRRRWLLRRCGASGRLPREPAGLAGVSDDGRGRACRGRRRLLQECGERELIDAALRDAANATASTVD